MLDLVKVTRSKKLLNSVWVDRLMLSWAASACESWRRLLAVLHALAGETRRSRQLRETSGVRTRRASVLTPADLLDELARVTRFTVRRALLISQAFSRQSAVGVRVLPVEMSDKYWLVVQAAGSVLTPTAVMALVLSMWRIAAELHWTSSFVILAGPFSRWEVWLGVAALLKLCDFVVNRMAKRVKGIDRAPLIVHPVFLVNEVFREANGKKSLNHVTLANNRSGD